MNRQTRRVNLIDRNVDMHVVRVVVDHAYALMFSVAEFLAQGMRVRFRRDCRFLFWRDPHHSVVIRKGKAHKPNEFGRLVRIDEVENGLVSNYAVAAGNLCDQQQWVPALEAHLELFGRAPQLAAADRGFWNSANEKAAAQLGVKHVVLPGRGRLSPARAARQKERWFRRGQGWRAGIEARLSTLKHRFGMQRALYQGEIGFERHVGWCIIAHNLVAMSRARLKSGTGRCRSG